MDKIKSPPRVAGLRNDEGAELFCYSSTKNQLRSLGTFSEYLRQISQRRHVRHVPPRTRLEEVLRKTQECLFLLESEGTLYIPLEMLVDVAEEKEVWESLPKLLPRPRRPTEN